MFRSVLSCVFIMALLSICVFSTSFIYGSAYADNFNPGAPWVLHWNDEFDGTALDLSKWQYEIGTDFGTGEIEYCTDRPQNVFVSNGLLNIRAIRENYNGCSFTSGRIRTYGRFATRYGKVVAKMKLPYGYGVWPAFWMLGNNYQSRIWPKCGELDIMEMRGGEDNTVVSSFHWYVTTTGYTGPADAGNSYTFGQRLADDWHIYEMDWTPTSINYKFDGIQVSSMDIGDPSGSNWFNYPFFIILDLAIGGRFWSPAITNPAQVTAALPQSMQLDWVRVYKDSSLNLPAPAPATQNLAVYTETHTGLDANARGAQMFLWENTCTLATAAPGAGGEGSECYQLTIGNLGWMGLGIAGPPLGDNLLNHKSSYLRFKIKTTAACGFKAGIECGGVQKWVTLGPEYGYANDGQWHNISIPMADLAGLDFEQVTQYFMFLNVNGTTAGNVVYLDDIYWTSNSEQFPVPVVSGGQEIIINSETHSGYNVMSNGAMMDSWENTVTITNDAAAAREGSTGWKVTVGNAGWFGWGISTKTRDLSAFRNSTLKFDIKSTAASKIKVSMQSAQGYDCYYSLDKFGYVNDGQWHNISIPCNQMYGIDFSQVAQYLMFLFDGAVTAGDVFYIDNVYFTVGTGTVTATPTPTRAATVTPTPTRAATATPIPTPVSGNLALNKTATASSTENASYPASSAVDGNAGTRWASVFSDPQWISVDLGATYAVNQVKLNWEAACASSYTIQTSTNGTNWATVWSTTSGTGGVVTINFTTTNAKYVRMYGTVRATAWGYSLWEFEVYGSGSATPTPTSTPTATPTPTRAATATPTPVGMVLPGKIEAESYNNMSGIQTESCSEGTQNVGWIDLNDWMDYNVNVQTAGNYRIDYRVASPNTTGKVDFRIGSATLASTTIPNTGGWQNWTTVSANVNLSSGNQTIRIFASGGGWNINWFSGTAIGATPTPTRVATATPTPTRTATATPTPIPGGDKCTGGTISVSSTNSPAGEDMTKAFDDTSSTKWLVVSPTGWIQYDFAGTTAWAINQYTITSANDAPARDPKNWTLQGSNNGTNWTTVDTRTNETFASRFLKKTYSFTNTTAYQMYRLNITANNGDTLLQLAEIEMFAGASSTPTPTSGPSVTTWYLYNTSVSGVSPAGQIMQTTNSGTSGWQPIKSITTTPSYWYASTETKTYATGTWTFYLWSNNPGSSTVKVDIYKVSSTGGSATLIASQTQEAGNSAGGNHATTYTFSGIAAQSLNNQRLRVVITKTAGANLTICYNTNDFPTRLVTP